MTDSGIVASAKQLAEWVWSLPKRAVNRIFAMPERAPVWMLAVGIVLLLVSAYPLTGQRRWSNDARNARRGSVRIARVFFIVDIALERLLVWFFDG